MAISIHRQTSAPPLGVKKSLWGQTPSRLWLGVWRGNPPSWDLLLAALLAVLLFTAPIGYVFLRAIQAGAARWQVLLTTRVPVLLGNTLALMGAVTIGAMTVGVTCAFLIERTDLPGHRILQMLLAMPLIIPPYVGALTAIIVLGPAGLLRDLLGRAPIRLYSFGGVAVLLILFTYPYIYLMTAAALRRLNRSFEEAARSCGLPYHQVLVRVILPMLRPAIGAGAVLVALYVLSDFGLVSLMRYDTFTRAIYFQMTGRFDRSGAAVLSTLLIIITLGVLWIEIKTRIGRGYVQTVGTYRPPQRIPLGKLTLPALGFVLLILLGSVILPIGVLLYWGAQGIAQGALNANLIRYLTNSLRIAAPTAVVAMILAVPVAYLRSRHPSAISRAVDRIVSAGYALPGVIVALGIIFLFNRYLPWFYATPGMVMVGCLMRFLPQSLRSADASLELVAPRLDEAARGMGVRVGLVLWKVILPIILPGVLAGGALVFVSTMKELPATLLLRPAGFDTLAVRVWMEAHEGFYAAAALPALLLVLSSALPLSWMIRRYG